MIDPRTEELLHEDLDGRLDAAGRAELQQRLAGDAEARALHADLAKMEAAWASLASLPVPPGLESRLRRALPRAAAPSRPSRSARILRPLSALAAGVLLAALGLSWLAPTYLPAPANFTDDPSVAGDARVGATLAAPPVQGGGSIPVAVGQPGEFTLQPSGDGWRVVLDLAAGQPVVVDLAYDAMALRLSGYPPVARLSEAGADGRATIASTGGRLEMRLDPLVPAQGPAGARVRVRVEAEGGEIREAVLEAGPGRR